MGILRVVLWTALCFGLGLWSGTAQVGGKTPWQHAQGLWKQQGPRLEKVKESATGVVDGAAGVVEDVKFRVAPGGDGAGGPRERHSKADREAIDQIIAKRGQGK